MIQDGSPAGEPGDPSHEQVRFMESTRPKARQEWGDIPNRRSKMRFLILWLFLVAPFAADAGRAAQRPAVKYTNPEGLAAPTGYTHVVEVSRGRTIYISGQVALDKSGNVVGSGDFKAQVRQVFENLKMALASGGAGFENLVKINTYVTDMTQLQALRDIRSSYFGKTIPASTLVQVVRLARPEFMIEIEAIAVVPE
jgi:2-iminobutanoate/2-iminopropanoate deaminase